MFLKPSKRGFPKYRPMNMPISLCLRSFLPLFALVFATLLPGFLVGEEGEPLRPGDLLAISVYNHPELEISARIAHSGAIRVPLAGRVEAAGMSPHELADRLGKAWQERGIADAFVTILVSEYTPRRAYVLGQVSGGGKNFDIPPVGSLTAMQAITAAGGFSDRADLRRVAVLRKTGDTTKRLPVDAIGFVEANEGAVDVTLLPGDIVVVPRALPVTILGMVGSPGTIEIDTAREVLCTQAIGFAGGLQKGALREAVIVLRQIPGSEPSRLVVNVGAALGGSFADDIPVLPGDVIVVKGVDQVYVAGAVGSPGAIDFDSDISLTVMRAITLRGGFSSIANQRRVVLVRDSTTTEMDLRDVLVNADRTGNDLELKPGDMVFVRESLW